MGTARWILYLSRYTVIYCPSGGRANMRGKVWVSMTMRILSLKQRTGFEMIEAKTREEYWQKVYSFLKTGYRV